MRFQLIEPFAQENAQADQLHHAVRATAQFDDQG